MVILFLDDERAVVEMGTRILARLGYKVTAETDSLRALEVFSARPDEFDLIITDYTMPNLTGTDLAKEVRRIPLSCFARGLVKKLLLIARKSLRWNS